MKNRLVVSLTDERAQKTEYTVEADGLFMYKQNMSSADSLREFVTDFHQSMQDFNECYGAYRICIIYEGGTVYFSDNSGMIRFYINTGEQRMYNSLEDAEDDRTKRMPNYQSIAQFLAYGCVYGLETVIRSVSLSDPNLYYILKEDKLEEYSKGLKELTDYRDRKKNLREIVAQAAAHCEGKIGCTITGGVDSRSVLANLIDLGIQPHLAVTGHESQADVKIAREIAEELKLDFSVVPDAIDEDSWINQSISAADGQEGVCGIYRLCKLARHLEKNGIELQFGGVAGELYKNSFIIQDFPFYFGKPKWGRFYQYKVGTFDLPESLPGDKIRADIDSLRSKAMAWLNKYEGRNKAEAYLNAGYEIMQARCNPIINMFQKHTTSYNPLMERRMASYAFGINPYKLEMQAYQRKEVSEKCGRIKRIRTDRGLTCDYHRRGKEFIKSYLFLIKIAMDRLLFRKKMDIRIDPCFEKGLQHPLYHQAIKKVKELGIIDCSVKPEEIPTGLADRLFTIGLLFRSAE